MGYVISEILICLLIAASIGFLMGWYWQWLGWEKKEANLEGLFSSRLENCNSHCADLKMRSEDLARKLAKERKEHRRVREQLRELRKPPTNESAPEPASTRKSRQATPGKTPLFFDSPPERIDNLKQISGVGPVLEKMLHRLGIYQFDQIAGFADADVIRVAGELGAFRGRITRDNWVEQAKRLLEAREATS